MNSPLALSDRVREALGEGRAVVALETSVLAQGLPDPRNLEARETMTHAIRSRGAEAAWVLVEGGLLRVGASEGDLDRVAAAGNAAKVARRDLPMAIAGGRLGATTVSATVWAADRAGIEVSVTGGIGGVHLASGDVSADLFELARTPGTLVCSGPKSIVDLQATAERIEELGIGLIGYRCETLPSFLLAGSTIHLEHRADSPADIASASRARRNLGVASALLVCNPIPADRAMDDEVVSDAVRACVEQADKEWVTGKDVTPFLLSCLAERTAGASLEANLALLESNAALAADIAVALRSGT